MALSYESFGSLDIMGCTNTCPFHDMGVTHASCHLYPTPRQLNYYPHWQSESIKICAYPGAPQAFSVSLLCSLQSRKSEVLNGTIFDVRDFHLLGWPIVFAVHLIFVPAPSLWIIKMRTPLKSTMRRPHQYRL